MLSYRIIDNLSTSQTDTSHSSTHSASVSIFQKKNWEKEGSLIFFRGFRSCVMWRSLCRFVCEEFLHLSIYPSLNIHPSTRPGASNVFFLSLSIHFFRFLAGLKINPIFFPLSCQWMSASLIFVQLVVQFVLVLQRGIHPNWEVYFWHSISYS